MEDTLVVRFCVQSAEYSCVYLDSRVDVFIQQEIPELLAELSQDDWDQFVVAQAKKLLADPQTMPNESRVIWEEIKVGTEVWDRSRQELDALHKLSRKDVCEFYKEHLRTNGIGWARLALHMTGQAFEQQEVELTVGCSHDAILIDDLDSFKRSSDFYEYD